MKRLIFIPLFLILLNSYAATYYVAPTTATPVGSDSNSGTIAAPWLTFQKALQNAHAGDTVYFRGGNYYPTATIRHEPYSTPLGTYGYNGTPDDPICFFNYPDEVPVFDYSLKHPLDGFNTGFLKMFVDFVHYKGLTFTNLWQWEEENEVEVIMDYACSNLIYENVTIHHCSGAGFRYFATIQSEGGTPPWNRYDYDTLKYINCDAYHLCDSLVVSGNLLGNKADGWKTSEESGCYKYWEGCRAWNCSDDGFDPSGGNFRDFKNCWSFNNGYSQGDGYGWKVSGPGENIGDTSLTLRFVNCIAAYNRAWGFGEVDQYAYYKNVLRMYNNIAYHNRYGIGNDFRELQVPDRENIFRNNICYANTESDIQLYYYIHDHNSWDTPGITVSDADFVLIDSAAGVTEMMAARKADHSLPDLTFLTLAGTSDLINAGTDTICYNGNFIHIIDSADFSGTEPDMGYAEYDEGEEEDTAPLVSTTPVTNITSRRARSGGTVTSDGGDTVTQRGICYSTSTNPTTASSKVIVAGTIGSFTANITGLTSNTTYHVKAYATNGIGTSYGSEEDFTTREWGPGKSGSVYVFSGGHIIKIE